MYRKFLIILTFIIFLKFINCILQGVDVQGRILCHKRPLKNITIELMEGDVFSDDILNRTQTDKDGYFNLYGQDEEFTIIEPYIKINHFCSIYNKTEEANSTMFLYLPDTVMNSYNHYSEYSHNFGDVDLYKLLK